MRGLFQDRRRKYSGMVVLISEVELKGGFSARKINIITDLGQPGSIINHYYSHYDPDNEIHAKSYTH